MASSTYPPPGQYALLFFLARPTPPGDTLPTGSFTTPPPAILFSLKFSQSKFTGICEVETLLGKIFFFVVVVVESYFSFVKSCFCCCCMCVCVKIFRIFVYSDFSFFRHLEKIGSTLCWLLSCR